MKGLAPLFLGIFGTFAFSWAGLTLIPNWQIGHLNPQSDEEGGDTYPMPQSGMFERGARVYAANGCIYCHSQQVRADYAGADIERKWGNRRSAPRDYIFERPVFLGKMRIGQDIANVGARAPAEQESPQPAGAATPPASPAPQGGAPAPGAVGPGGKPSPSPGNVGSPAPGAPSPAAPAASPPPVRSPGTQGAAVSSPPPQGGSPSPASSPTASPAAAAATSPVPNASPIPKPTAPVPPSGSPPASPSVPRPNEPPASPAAPVAAAGSPAAPSAPWPEVTTGEPPMYSAAWHHVHLYSPRSTNVDSVMPSYRFLYQTRRISDAPSAEALHLTGPDAPPEGWEIVPTFDAKCLVAYLMSLNQSHPLKEVRSAAPPAASPAASPAPSPAVAPAK
jgi:cbb3-type cytochrome oxidase cytochrome c subunit